MRRLRERPRSRGTGNDHLFGAKGTGSFFGSAVSAWTRGSAKALGGSSGDFLAAHHLHTEGLGGPHDLLVEGRHFVVGICGRAKPED